MIEKSGGEFLLIFLKATGELTAIQAALRVRFSHCKELAW